MIRACNIIHVTRTIVAPTADAAPTSPLASTTDLETTIMADFRATMTQLKCASSERLLREGVSMAQLHIMFTVQRHGEMTMSQLADVLNVSDSSATGLVDRMAERGFIQRDRVPTDRRVVIVRITDAGEGLLRQIDALSDEIFRTVLSRLEPSQLVGVSQAIADLRAAVDATVALDVDRHGVSIATPRSPTSLRGNGLANHPEGRD
jgi:DNA-binding MarR family transcriptional regulator